MKNKKYEEIAKKHMPKEEKTKDVFISFISGGILGLIAEFIIEELYMKFNLSRVESANYMIIIFIFIGSFLTALGIFDKLATKYKCGLLIPITGFSHSITSTALDYKNEGPIYGIGSNFFKLAGSVILYGIISAFIFGLIRYVIGGYI